MIYDALDRIGVARFTEVVSELDALIDLLEKSMSRKDAELMTDLVALSAVEVQLLGDALSSREGSPEYPVTVQQPAVTVAIAKTACLPTWGCRIPSRIAGGDVRLSDCFLFTGDLTKVEEILQTATMSEFRQKFVSTVAAYINQMTETPVGERIGLNRDAYVAAALVWRARLDVLSSERNPDLTAPRLDQAAHELGADRFHLE